MPELERLDEVGAMARALLVLRDNSRDGVALRLDSLTGLANRKVLMDRLKQALAASARNEFYGGLILIDMDKFKALNDTQGHDVGNMLLRTVATRLTACVRAADIVARLGGDEFVVVVLDISRQEEEAAAALESVGEKVLAALARTYQLGHVVHTLTASIGLTLLKADAVSGEELLKQADLALYKSKETGRNACRLFDPIMEATVHERAALESDLRHAIAGGQFSLHYQAQVDVDGRLNGAEALLRWDHPIRGLVQPLEFIALTEKTDLILPSGPVGAGNSLPPVGVLAVRSDMADLKIAVNVSVRQFQRNCSTPRLTAPMG